MKSTGEQTSNASLHGDKLYQERAREALPLLIRQAKARQSLVYSELADELGMPNPRNLNYVLGQIGNSLEELGKEWKDHVPPLQCIVISKASGLPGEGIAWFIKDKETFRKSSHSHQREMLTNMLHDVYSYPKWDEVLQHFKLKPNTAPVKVFTKLNVNARGQGTGESALHLAFKNFIAKNPSAVGHAGFDHGRTEFTLPSADSIDVLFESSQLTLGVEVKSRISDPTDILRGLFQCVKYAALLEAHNKVRGISPNVEVILALEGTFPRELVSIKNILGIQVLDQIPTKGIT